MSLPKGQNWLVSRMRKMGYTADQKGVCFGLTHMAMQAILAEEIDIFDQRLETIYNFSLNEIAPTIDALKEKRKQTKGLPIHPLLDIPAFFEGIELYHNISSYPFLFEEKSNPQIQNAMMTAPLVIPQVFKENDIEIIKPAAFTGCYTKEDLIDYFDSLRSTVQQSNPPLLKPFTMVLRSAKHAITVAYDPKKDEWLFINANELPTQHFAGSENTIAEKVLSAFSKNDITTFATEIYTTNTNKTAIKACVKRWQNQEVWKKIHTVSTNKATAVDSANTSWLYIAAKHGCLDTVNKLITEHANVNIARTGGFTALYIATERNYPNIIKALLDAGANVNLANTNGITPFYIAVQRDNRDLINLFLAKKANVNLKHIEGTTPLYLAAQKGYAETVNILLAEHADVNLARTNGATALYAAAEQGYLGIVQALLAAGANVDHTCTDGATALFIAAHKGYFTVVKALLDANANVNLVRTNGTTALFAAAVNGYFDVMRLLVSKGANIDAVIQSDSKTLLLLAKEHNTEARMNALLNKKRSTTNISVTNEEIARVMGHSEIADYLKYRKEFSLQKNKNDARYKALQHYFNNIDTKEGLINFKKLDEIALSLSNIAHIYHSKTLFHGENKERKTSVDSLVSAANDAYNAYINGVAINQIVNTLITTAEKISLDTKKDHSKASPIKSLFFTKSRLSKHIDAVVSPLHQIKVS